MSTGQRKPRLSGAALDDRRREVLKYHLRGYSQRWIAEKIGWSLQTINADLKAAMVKYRHETDALIDDLWAKRLAQSEEIIDGLHSNIVSGEADMAQVVAHNHAATREAKMLGLEKPRKVDVEMTIHDRLTGKRLEDKLLEGDPEGLIEGAGDES